MALGAHRFVAFRPLLRRTIKTALTPLIHAMSAGGFLAVPDMMSGQILAGADQVMAAKYQIALTWSWGARQHWALWLLRSVVFSC
jgi:putative ABC transport system permease protein